MEIECGVKLKSVLDGEMVRLGDGETGDEGTWIRGDLEMRGFRSLSRQTDF